MKEKVKSNKYIIIMIVLINFMMTPLMMGLIGHFSSFVVVLNFTLVILASLIAAEQRVPKVWRVVRTRHLSQHLVGIYLWCCP